MAEPNMSLAAFDRWTDSKAFREYKADHDGRTVNAVVRRTRKFIKETASEAEKNKVRSFISRMKANSAGERKYGSPPVSARTASLRNWGYDPTGKYS